MKTSTKVLLGVGAAGVAGFVVWRLYEAGKEVGTGDLIVPDEEPGWGGWDTTTNDGNGATFGPRPSIKESMPTEEYAQPAPLGAAASHITTSSGPDYMPVGKGAAIAEALGIPRPSIGTEANKPFADARYSDPCAGIICPPNHVCGGGKCYAIE